MFSESKITEIYCMADDFCKEFSFQQEKYMIEDKKTGHRNKPNRMSDAEIMVILILFHSGGFRCFKHYYKEYVCKHLEHLFPWTNRRPITVLWNWRRRCCSPLPFTRKSCWLSVLWTPLLYMSVVTKGF